MPDTLYQFIQNQTAFLEPLDKAVNLAYGDFTTTGKPEYEKELARLQIEMRRMYANPERFEELQTLLAEYNGEDSLLTRQAVLLQNIFAGNQMDDETIEDLTRQEVAIEGIFNTFRAQLNGRQVSENDIKDILRHSADLELRQKAW